MDVHAFDLNSPRLQAFIDLPWRLYEADEKWIPPLRAEEHHLLSSENHFFRYGSIRNFLAERGGMPVGRCSAIRNERLEANEGPVGLFGFFEAADETAAEALLDAACDWLSEQGCERARGPMDFTIWHRYRLMTRGFDEAIFYGEPYNPPAYPEYVEGHGFEPLARWYSWNLEEPHLRGMLEAAGSLKNPDLLEAGYTVSNPFDLENFESQMQELHTLLDEGFSQNLGYSKLDYAEFRALFDGLRHILVPELSPVIRAPDGSMIGFGYLYPDLSHVMRAADGDATRFADPAFLAEQGQGDRLIFHTVVFQKQHRKKGLVETTLGPLLERMFAAGFTRGVGALAKEGPTIYHKTGEPTREYALYERPL